jgi:hypothetical protein
MGRKVQPWINEKEMWVVFNYPENGEKCTVARFGFIW